MANANTITVTLLDKEYQVACPPEEQDALLRAARSLDGRLRAIRDSGAIVGLERIAIMAALNLSYELQQSSQRSSAGGANDELLQSLSDKVDMALGQLKT